MKEVFAIARTIPAREWIGFTISMVICLTATIGLAVIAP